MGCNIIIIRVLVSIVTEVVIDVSAIKEEEDKDRGLVGVESSDTMKEI